MTGIKAAFKPRVSPDVRATLEASNDTSLTLPDPPEAKVEPRFVPAENVPEEIVLEPENT
tara:strand:- start:104 stop:283 length:180 start_codon:yes stop_codon:yes gene_type:complete